MSAILGLLRCATMAWILVPLLERPVGAVELFGYVGPGAGLSMLGALFAVACVILLALLGPILYPIRALRVWLRGRRERMSDTVGGTQFLDNGTASSDSAIRAKHLP